MTQHEGVSAQPRKARCPRGGTHVYPYEPERFGTGCLKCGAEPPEVCPRCHGDGEITVNTSRIRDPQMDREERCPDCHGEGTVEVNPSFLDAPTHPDAA